MYKSFLIKYAEIGVKGKNRYLFEEALVKQIKYALKKVEGEFTVRRTDGRIYVDAQSEFDFDEVVESLKKVFGISGICPVVHVEDEGFENWDRMWCIILATCTRTAVKALRWRRGARAKTIRLIPCRSMKSWAA